MSFRRELDDFGAFYERNYQTAYRTSFGIVGDAAVAADLTQDAFYKAYKTRASFRGDSPARSWLLRIVVNGAISVRRRPRVGILDLTSEPEDTGLGHAERLELSMAMECLSNRQRAALVLRYYHGFDYDSIAELMGTNSGTVGSLLNRAVAALRKELSPDRDPVVGNVDGKGVTDVG
jgi:RNA polymerase sigma-70 factor (ECF subfamily)